MSVTVGILWASGVSTFYPLSCDIAVGQQLSSLLERSVSSDIAYRMAGRNQVRSYGAIMMMSLRDH